MASEVRIHTPLRPDMDAVATAEHAEESHAPASAMPKAEESTRTGGTLSDLLHLPVLPAPSGSMDMENLMDSLNFEGRRQACKQGLDSIAANAMKQKDVNTEMVNKMRDNLEKMDAANRLAGIMKILGIVALVVSAVVTVATLGAAGPVMACISLALLANSIASYASDGKYCFSALVAKVAEECGASEETAKWIGFGMELAVSVAVICVSIVSTVRTALTKAGEKATQSVVSGATKAAQQASQHTAEEASKAIIKTMNNYAAQLTTNTIKLSTSMQQASGIAKAVAEGVSTKGLTTAEKILQATKITTETLAKSQQSANSVASLASRIWKEGFGTLLSDNAKKIAAMTRLAGNMINAGTSVAQGGLTIAHASVMEDATESQASARRLEALLARLREYAEVERAMVKNEMERCNSLMESVINIVHSNNDALERLTTTSHTLA